MSTEILRKKLPITAGSDIEEDLVIRRYGRHNRGRDCAYTISIGGRAVDIDSHQMREIVDTLKMFFRVEGYK